MLRFRKLKCLFLSSWFGQSNYFNSTVLSNANRRIIPQLSISNLVTVCRPATLGYQDCLIIHMHTFSTVTGTVLVVARDPAKLSLDIQNAVDEHRYHDAWRYFEQHLEMEGFPRKSLVNKLLTSFAETLDSHWLDQVFRVVEQAFEEGKQTLFEKETLLYLSLALARCGSPVCAAILLRRLIAMGEYPPVSAWSAVIAHMSQSASGAYLAAELILEIGYLFQNNRIDPRKKSNAPLIAMKPNTLAFNIALAGCLLFGTTRVTEQLLDMRPKIGVKTDTALLIMMAQTYECNGRREELKKLRRRIDEADDLDETRFRQYYNCLLNFHLKFGDLDSASQMVLEMLRKAKEARNAIAAATLIFDPNTRGGSPPSQTCDDLLLNTPDKGSNHAFHFLSFVDFCRDRNFIHLVAGAKEILTSLSLKLQRQIELVTTERGILQPTEEAYVKLSKAFLDSGKMKELAEFLIEAEKLAPPFM